MKIIKTSQSEVIFETEDGRRMFEITLGKDGRSIGVRAPDMCRIDGVLYASLLAVEPESANSLTIRTRPYGN